MESSDNTFEIFLPSTTTRNATECQPNLPMSLPADILGEMFMHIVAERGVIEIPRHITNTSPWSLGQVCSAWREVVYSQPLLWKNLRFVAFLHGLFSPGFELDRLDRILPYGLSALHVIDNFPGVMPDFTLDEPCLSRLETLSVDGSLSMMITLLSVKPSSFKAPLQEISLFLRNESDPPMIEELLCSNLFSITGTHLKSLTFDDDDLGKGILSIPHIHWCRLSSLDIGSVYFPELWMTLGRCVSLNHLTCSNKCLKAIPSAPLFPALEQLEISGQLSMEEYSPIVEIILPKWNHLTKLSFNYVNSSLIDNILRQVLHTKSLTVKCALAPALDSDVPFPILCLDSLEFLSINSYVVHLFDNLKAPRLTTLKIGDRGRSGCQNLSTFLIQQIISFINRSAITLDVFHCHSVNTLDDKGDKVLRQLFIALRPVRDFSVPNYVFTKNQLNYFKQNAFLPNVQSFTVRVESPRAFATAIEVRVRIGLREEGFIRLKTAHAYYPSSCKSGGRKDVQRALMQIGSLNEEYGTDFGMTERW